MAEVQELISENLASLNKPHLLEMAQELQKTLKDISERTASTTNNNIGFENVLLRLSMIESQQLSSATEIERLKKENKSLKKRVHNLEEDLEGEMDGIEDRFVEIEKAVSSCEQYTRRENFEISGIPEDVTDENLQEKVLEIVNTVTERNDDKVILPKDVHACHRLKKDPGEETPKVIVRMVNRQHTIDVLKSKKKTPEKQEHLQNNKLYISENLCNTNKTLLDEAKKLKKNGQLKRCWTFNGIVHIKIKENDPKGKKILHLSDFEKFFTAENLGWE